MAGHRKILWTEGMFLSPHHFQQWDRYQEHLLQSRLSSLTTFGWGLTHLEINQEGLANGHFSVVNCKGVFPGGAVFDVPGTDEPVPERVLTGVLDPSVQTVDVFLALPSRHASSANLSVNDAESQPTRYRQGTLQITDENTGDNEREVAIARSNLKLLFGEESLENHDHIRIARLKQDNDGSVSLDDTYIPPCLHISSSALLTGMIRRLLEILHAKSSTLSETRSQRTTGLVEYSSSDLGNFWLLHTVNSFIPLLDHYYRVPQTHPETMFTSLAQLAGALTTFSPSAQPGDLPNYNHSDLTSTFLDLEKAIQELLRAVVPTGAVEIPLSKESDSKFTAQVESDEVLVGSQIFLVVKADLPEHQLIKELPKQAKISSIDQIGSLLGLALPGVSLSHSPAPPAPLRIKLGHQYFRLEARGDSDSRKHWEEICKSRTLAIRVPGQRFPSLALELWSIKE